MRTGRTSLGTGAPGRQEARAQLVPDLPDEHVVAAWIGRSGRQKGADALPALAGHLAEHGVLLAALGDGLEESGIADGIRARGGLVVGSPSPSALLAASDLLVSTSAWEGLPLVVIEALEQGLPVVAYDVGGLREQVVEGRNGHLVGAGDAAALVDRVAALALSPETRRTFGDASRQIWLERFRPGTMVERIELVYAHVLERR